MDNADQLTLETLLAWLESGHKAVLVTVAVTWGSAPRPPGAWVAIREDGAVVGSVSGGCIEDDLVARVRAGEFARGAVSLARYGVTAEEASRFGLPCGGTLELVIEHKPNLTQLSLLQERLTGRQLTRRTLDIASGQVDIAATTADAVLTWDRQQLVTVYGPRWRLLLIGAGQISTHLARMARNLDYEVFVCDPREEYRPAWHAEDATLIEGMPDDVVRALVPDAHTAIVTLTHDPKLDDMALLEALHSAAFYVGALGSKVSNTRRRERLAQYFDMDAAALSRLRGPAGLSIGSRTPPEIALSIMAEVTAAKNGVALPPQSGGAPTNESAA